MDIASKIRVTFEEVGFALMLAIPMLLMGAWCGKAPKVVLPPVPGACPLSNYAVWSWLPIVDGLKSTHLCALFSFHTRFWKSLPCFKEPPPPALRPTFSFPCAHSPHLAAQGLLSLAFTPGFHTTGVFYVTYVANVVSAVEYT